MKTTLLLALLAGLGLTHNALAAGTGLKPGMWEISTQTAMPNMPNLPKIPAGVQIPPEIQAKMAQKGIQISGANINAGQVSIRHCLTKEQAERNEAPKGLDKNCQQTSVQRSGNTISYQMSCTGDHPATGSGQITINSPESYTGSNTITAHTNNYGNMTINTSMQGRWIGACQ